MRIGCGVKSHLQGAVSRLVNISRKIRLLPRQSWRNKMRQLLLRQGAGERDDGRALLRPMFLAGFSFEGNLE